MTGSILTPVSKLLYKGCLLTSKNPSLGALSSTKTSQTTLIFPNTSSPYATRLKASAYSRLLPILARPTHTPPPRPKPVRSRAPWTPPPCSSMQQPLLSMPLSLPGVAVTKLGPGLQCSSPRLSWPPTLANAPPLTHWGQWPSWGTAQTMPRLPTEWSPSAVAPVPLTGLIWYDTCLHRHAVPQPRLSRLYSLQRSGALALALAVFSVGTAFLSCPLLALDTNTHTILRVCQALFLPLSLY